MNFRKFVKTLAILTFVLTSCSDDDCNLDHNSNQLGLPVLKQGTFPEGDVNLNIGDTYIYSPEVVSNGDIYYQWYLNDKDMGTDKKLVVEANTSMRSKLVLELTNDNGTIVLENKVIVSGANYSGKYIVLNEGWFGHEPGNVTILNPENNTVQQWVFRDQNYGATLGVTSQSATLWNDKLYICSKDNIHLTVVDPKTMYVEKQSGKILGSRQAYEFIGINEKYGVLTANGDLYRVDLETLEAEQILMSDGWNGTGSGIVYNNKLLINVKGKKLHVLDIDKVLGDLSQYSYTKYFPFETLDIQTTGGCRFVKGNDGNLYTVESSSTGNNLVRIKPDFTLEKKTMRPDYSPSSFGFYREAMFCGNASGDKFYYVARGKIYKSTFDNASPETPFTSYSKSGYSFYGAAVRVNPYNNEVVAMYLTDDYKQNLLVRFNGDTGEMISETSYEGYYFLATFIFVK
ncbi:MAG: DUF5074 domain-containing protein [Dysgonomonas sp.]|nr:DUF5074 domain-containing protein [Dysgonomonas sp.]